MGAAKLAILSRSFLRLFVHDYGIDMDIPVKDIPSHLFDKNLYGSGSERIYFKYENDFGQVRENEIEFEGVLRNIERRYKETSSDYIREQMENIWPISHVRHVKDIV